MNLLQIFNNKFLRIIGIAAVLYFAFFSGKNENGLHNLLNKENIGQSVEQLNKQAQTISYGLAEAKKESEMLKMQQAQATNNNILIDDLKIGDSAQSLLCYDEAQISYEVFASKDNKKLKIVGLQQIVIGNRANNLIEKNIIGMKKGGIRTLKIPVNYNTGDKELVQMLRDNQELIYKIMLLDFANTPKSSANNNCF